MAPLPPSTPAHRIAPRLGLAGCGGLMALLFAWAFSARYSLAEFGGRPFQTHGSMSRYDPAGALIYVAGFAALFGLYALAYQAARHIHARRADWALLGGLAALLAACLLPMYPADAADVYDYAVRGRMTALYGINPMEYPPRTIEARNDPFYAFTAWKRSPSAYGPLWEHIAAALVRLSDDRNSTVVAFKLVFAAGYWLTGVALALALRRFAPERCFSGALLWWFNPLAVYASAGTTHQDPLVTLAMACALWAVAEKRYGWALLAATLGALIKFFPVLLVPLILIAWWRNARWQAALRGGLVWGGVCLLVAAAAYAPFWHGFDTLRVGATSRDLLFTGSWATLARFALIPVTDGVAFDSGVYETPNANHFLAQGTLVLFGLWALVQCWRMWRKASPEQFALSAAAIFLGYYLLAALWFHSWHVLWSLVFLAATPLGATRRIGLLYSYLVTWQALLYTYMVISSKADVVLPWLDLVPVLVYQGGIALYMAYLGGQALSRRWVWAGDADAARPTPA